jgi:replication factor A1
MVSIKELKEDSKKIDLNATVVATGEVREITAKQTGKQYKIQEVTLFDGTGTIGLNMWDSEIGKLAVNNKVIVKNGYVTAYKGKLQLNVGKYGTLTVE